MMFEVVTTAHCLVTLNFTESGCTDQKSIITRILILRKIGRMDFLCEK